MRIILGNYPDIEFEEVIVDTCRMVKISIGPDSAAVSPVPIPSATQYVKRTPLISPQAGY